MSITETLTESVIETIAAEVGVETADSVKLTRKQYRMVKRYRKLHIAQTALVNSKKALAAIFLTAMGGAKYATWKGEPVLRTQPSGRRSTDYDKLFETFPEAYAACVTEAEPGKRSVRTI